MQSEAVHGVAQVFQQKSNFYSFEIAVKIDSLDNYCSSLPVIAQLLWVSSDVASKRRSVMGALGAQGRQKGRLVGGVMWITFISASPSDNDEKAAVVAFILFVDWLDLLNRWYVCDISPVSSMWADLRTILINTHFINCFERLFYILLGAKNVPAARNPMCFPLLIWEMEFILKHIFEWIGSKSCWIKKLSLTVYETHIFDFLYLSPVVWFK